ncbi:hypothetical protein FAF44_09245 [Nonomuraea sp. MG754425]|uniref:hypothetical protein n=1 Tax=Nonomuraea sp. MG754425 TaxID=2570319 RepID=UPI001F3C3D99|nr:hypothetical protein [Nonomuraea sp. MG754425]MCF6468568.1 hypothetical protein [Nonomuraea sp. MG754425]
MRWRRAARIVGGTLLILLGLLWILQGADVVQIDPILCVADCRPVTGGSPGWLAAGVVAAAVGIVLVMMRPRQRRATSSRI